MAGNSRIVATIMAIGYNTGLADTDAEFMITYKCSGPVSGHIYDTVVLTANVTQNETQIKSDLSTALAALVNPLVTPPQSYTSTDIRGLNI